MIRTRRRSPRERPRASFRKEIFARLQLIRLPNLFTAMADVLAGYLIVAGAGFRWSILFALLLTTSCLYAAGCVLNDLRDREIDLRERPFRPIPSGWVSPREASILAPVLFALGLLAACTGGRHSVLIATVLIGLIVLYNYRAKHRAVVGPATMGTCRSANLLLGMSPALSAAGAALLFPALSFIYVFLLTCLSRFEVGGAQGAGLYRIAAGWVALALVFVALFAQGILQSDALPYFILLILFTAPVLFRGIRRPDPSHVEQAVKALVLGIPILDAVYASGVHGWKFGIPIILLLLPARWIARALYVT